MYRQASARRPTSIETGYKLVTHVIGQDFAVTQNYQAFKIFYVHPKVSNLAKKFEHKILDGCRWNVYYRVTPLDREDAAKQLKS